MNISKTFIILMLIFSPLMSQATDRLSGRWEGRWDDIYKCRFIITFSKSNNYHVLYEWEEHKGSRFLKNDYIGKKVNSNTILAKNIYLLSHPTDKNRAIAIGVFEQQTRMAYLKRIKKTSPED